MKRYLLGVLLMVFSLGAVADIDVRGLSEEQEAVLALQAAQMKSAEPTVPTVDVVSKWVGIGKDLGTGLNATAKELGMTANELATTPVGMFALVLIAWTYAGKSLIGIVFGFMWLGVTLPTWIWMYRHRFVLRSIEKYDKGARPDGLRTVKTFRDSTGGADGEHFVYLCAIAAIITVGLVAIFG